MININLQLLKQYFLLNSNHNVLYNIFENKDIVLNETDIDLVFEYLTNIIDINKEHSGLYSVNNKESLLKYIIEFIYHDLKVYRTNFSNLGDFQLFIYVCTSLFLTLFTQDALKILKYLPRSLKVSVDKNIEKVIHSYIDSNDPRGLIFYICQKYNLPYDILMSKEYVKYNYVEPSINKNWQKEYKTDSNPIVFWFYKSIIGKALFLVLYSPKCRYKMEHGGCSGCNLPTVSSPSKDLNTQDVIEQVDNTFTNNLSNQEKESIQELMLSNNGSILDPKTMDIEALEHSVLQAVKYMPNLKKIIFETRIDDYTDIKQLELIQKILTENNSNILLEIAIGFEIFDDKLRNGYYKKGLEKSILEEKMKNLAALDISLKVYMMYKAVPNNLMSVDEAIQDLNNAAEYFSDFVDKYKLNINMHISPTYLATGTPLFVEYKNNRYTPPSIDDIEKMYNSLIIKDNLSYYISMNDEGLADDRQSDINYDKFINLREKIHKFNISNFKN